MRSHISVHRATTKCFSISFIFKNKIEKEGLPKDSPARLDAGGPRFKSGRRDQFTFFVSHHIETLAFLLKPLGISHQQKLVFWKSFNLHELAA
jgi:hypothetical protein